MHFRVDTPCPAFSNDIMDVIRIFLGSDAVLSPEDPEAVLTHNEQDGPERLVRVRLSLPPQEWTAQRTGGHGATPLEEKRLHKRLVKQAVFDVCLQAFGMTPPWGSLTGIRPTRLMYMALDRGLSLKEAEEEMQREFSVTGEKASLLAETVLTQRSLSAQQAGEIDLYCGIPFCVSRCAYCSFLSGEVGKGAQLRPYTDALRYEIRRVTDLVDARHLRPGAFYMGGGTPTSLPEPLFREVLEELKPLLERCSEKTVEAGRPDTIDRGKLEAMKEAGIQRISINPQTGHDETLRLIGRRHTVAQTEEAYRLAREMGFDDINMDLIAGLPGETLDMFLETLQWTRSLAPESMTVHTLCIKHASLLHLWEARLPDGAMVADMVRFGRREAQSRGMRPYYLYRQKYMAGNLENVGYALPRRESLYNIGMMEETADVLALGAGGISKRVNTATGKILRAPNVSDIDHYIQRTDEMVRRKEALLEAGL